MTDLVVRNGHGAVSTREYEGDALDLIKRTVAFGASTTELQLFLYQCKRTGLDPLARQIYWIKRGEKGTIQTSIDGFRLIADRTGKYCGNDDPVFGHDAGGKYPATATVTVYKLVGGQRCPFTATARWSEYYPGERQGTMWHKMPHTMLGKCAESLALRKAFPADLSGLYTADEMAQANRDDVIDAPVRPSPRPEPRFTDPEAQEVADSHDTGKQRTSTADANEKNQRRVGIIAHKEWMKAHELDPEDQPLSWHLLGLVLGRPVTTRKDLTGQEWGAANHALASFAPERVISIVSEYRQVRELDDPYADPDVVEGALAE